MTLPIFTVLEKSRTGYSSTDWITREILSQCELSQEQAELIIEKMYPSCAYGASTLTKCPDKRNGLFVIEFLTRASCD